MGKVAVHYGWIPMILYIGIVVFWGEADFRIYAEFASAGVLEVVCCVLGEGLMVDCLRRLVEFDGVSCGGVIRVCRGRAKEGLR
jgi:TOM7 family